MNFIQLSNEGESNKNPTAAILTALERIESLEAEVIVLYANKETTELMLQQVMYICDVVIYICDS